MRILNHLFIAGIAVFILTYCSPLAPSEDKHRPNEILVNSPDGSLEQRKAIAIWSAQLKDTLREIDSHKLFLVSQEEYENEIFPSYNRNKDNEQGILSIVELSNQEILEVSDSEILEIDFLGVLAKQFLGKEYSERVEKIRRLWNEEKIGAGFLIVVTSEQLNGDLPTVTLRSEFQAAIAGSRYSLLVAHQSNQEPKDKRQQLLNIANKVLVILTDTGVRSLASLKKNKKKAAR